MPADTNVPGDSNISGINTPGIEYPSGKFTRKAVKDAAQAYAIAKAFENANRERDAKNAEIAKKYNGENPFSTAKMRASGQGSRANFSTRFMSAVVDRKIPEFVNVIESSQSLTNSELPKHWADGYEKAQRFRKRITDTIRSWPQWRDYLYRVAAENTLYGYQCSACTDSYNWRPEIFTQSNFYVPDDMYQFADACQVLVLKKPFMISEAIEKIADAQAADLAGWNLENMVEAINNARPKNRATSTTQSQRREWVDLNREGTIFESFQTGTKFIQTYDCYFQEANGTITQYMVNMLDGKELYKQESRYKKMADVAAFTTLQVGNGKLHGSNGLGKLLFNIAVAAERSMCMFTDAANMSSYKILRFKGTDAAKANQVKITVAQPFVVLVTDAEILDKIDLAPDPTLFISLYSQLVALAETISASVLPGSTNPLQADEKATATQVSIDAQRENEVKASQLARFAYMFSNTIAMMQRRLCDIETIDDEAKSMQKAMLTEDGLTAEEIQILAKAPVAKSLSDIEAMTKQNLEWLIAKYGLTDFIDKNRVAEKDIRANVGDELADAVLMRPETIETSEIENIQKQIQENATMITSQQEVPVSPRDNHVIHRQVIKQDLLKLAEVLPVSPDPKLLNAVSLGLVHYGAHIDAELAQGAKPEQLAEDIQWMQQTKEMIVKLGKAANDLIQGMPAES